MRKSFLTPMFFSAAFLVGCGPASKESNEVWHSAPDPSLPAVDMQQEAVRLAVKRPKNDPTVICIEGGKCFGAVVTGYEQNNNSDDACSIYADGFTFDIDRAHLPLHLSVEKIGDMARQHVISINKGDFPECLS